MPPFSQADSLPRSNAVPVGRRAYRRSRLAPSASSGQCHEKPLAGRPAQCQQDSDTDASHTEWNGRYHGAANTRRLGYYPLLPELRGHDIHNKDYRGRSHCAACIAVGGINDGLNDTVGAAVCRRYQCQRQGYRKRACSSVSLYLYDSVARRKVQRHDIPRLRKPYPEGCRASRVLS